MNTKGLVSAKKKILQNYTDYIYILENEPGSESKRFWSGLVIFQTIHIIQYANGSEKG